MRNLLSALALVAVFTGLSQAASVAQPVPVVPKAAPKNATPKNNDAQIERTIKAKFARSKINVEHFTVTVQNGIATLDGTTNVIQHKGVATRLARTGGAVAVQNHIQISEEARAKAAAKLAKYRNGDTQIARATVIPASK